MRAHITIDEVGGEHYEIDLDDYSVVVLAQGIVLQGRFITNTSNSVVYEDGTHLGQYSVDEKWEHRGP